RPGSDMRRRRDETMGLVRPCGCLQHMVNLVTRQSPTWSSSVRSPFCCSSCFLCWVREKVASTFQGDPHRLAFYWLRRKDVQYRPETFGHDDGQ
ncbi:hypothetical protein T310_9967, partial [Rasamsonia emersonii CBS 393.64]